MRQQTLRVQYVFKWFDRGGQLTKSNFSYDHYKDFSFITLNCLFTEWNIKNKVPIQKRVLSIVSY